MFNPHFYPARLKEDLEDVSLQVGVWLYPEGEIPYPTEGDIVFDQTSMPGMEDNPLIIPPPRFTRSGDTCTCSAGTTFWSGLSD